MPVERNANFNLIWLELYTKIENRPFYSFEFFCVQLIHWLSHFTSILNGLNEMQRSSLSIELFKRSKVNNAIRHQQLHRMIFMRMHYFIEYLVCAINLSMFENIFKHKLIWTIAEQS